MRREQIGEESARECTYKTVLRLIISERCRAEGITVICRLFRFLLKTATLACLIL